MQKHPNSFALPLEVEVYIIEKHKPIKCQEQLTSLFLMQHELRKFYRAPIIKVNKNECISPQWVISHSDSSFHNAQGVSNLHEACGFTENVVETMSVIFPSSLFSKLTLFFMDER